MAGASLAPLVVVDVGKGTSCMSVSMISSCRFPTNSAPPAPKPWAVRRADVHVGFVISSRVASRAVPITRAAWGCYLDYQHRFYRCGSLSVAPLCISAPIHDECLLIAQLREFNVSVALCRCEILESGRAFIIHHPFLPPCVANSRRQCRHRWRALFSITLKDLLDDNDRKTWVNINDQVGAHTPIVGYDSTVNYAMLVKIDVKKKAREAFLLKVYQFASSTFGGSHMVCGLQDKDHQLENIKEKPNGKCIHACIDQCTPRWLHACPFEVGRPPLHAKVVIFITTAWVSCGQHRFYRCGLPKALLCLPLLVSSALLAELEPTECSQGYQTPPSLQALSRHLLAGVLWRGVLRAFESNHHFYLCETCCTVVNGMFTHSAVGSSMAITCPGEGERQPGFYPGGCFPLPRVSTGFTGAGAVSTGFTGADILRGPMMTKL